MSQATAISDAKIVETIEELLEREFGKTEAEAIGYYADTKLALANTEEYTRALLCMFGAGTEHLLAAIITGLAGQFGVKVKEETTLDELISTLKQRPTA